MHKVMKFLNHCKSSLIAGLFHCFWSMWRQIYISTYLPRKKKTKKHEMKRQQKLPFLCLTVGSLYDLLFQFHFPLLLKFSKHNHCNFDSSVFDHCDPLGSIHSHFVPDDGGHGGTVTTQRPDPSAITRQLTSLFLRLGCGMI